MGSKPKKSEYKPSETEKTQAAIAAADERYFRQTYDPLLQELRDKAATEDVAATLRGRAQADTYQALTGGGADIGAAEDIGTAANLAVGATGQILDANRAAKDAKVTEQVGVLGTARGQAADAGDALAKASKLARSEGLAKAQAKQTVRMARRKAAFDIGSALGQQGLKNLGKTGKFFTRESEQLMTDPNDPNSFGYQQYGVFGRKKDFRSLGTYMPTPKNTGGG
tara:strand:+ start:524 stop:1198 length:675 start_codon:yes stop_codon:yes gene_type:complete